jgi:hypothetical protein
MDRGIWLYAAKNSGSSYLFCRTEAGIAAKRRKKHKKVSDKDSNVRTEADEQELIPTGAILVRPDGYVGARWEKLEGGSKEQGASKGGIR